MVSQDSKPADRLVTGRTNRRRFLAGAAAAGLTPVAVAAEATIAMRCARPRRNDHGATV